MTGQTVKKLMLGLTLAAPVALGGCSGDMFNSGATDQWFSKPFTNFSKRDWAAIDVAKDPNALRPITPEDYVDASGRCVAAPVPTAPTGDTAAPASGDAPTASGGIALTMTECEVAQRAGTPQQVDLGANAAGERTAKLTYTQGPWPGIYSFTAGRLAVIDAVAVPEKPKSAPKKRPARAKTAAS